MNASELMRALVYALYKKSGEDIKIKQAPDNFWCMLINHEDGTLTIRGVLPKQ